MKRNKKIKCHSFSNNVSWKSCPRFLVNVRVFFTLTRAANFEDLFTVYALVVSCAAHRILRVFHELLCSFWSMDEEAYQNNRYALWGGGYFYDFLSMSGLSGNV